MLRFRRRKNNNPQRERRIRRIHLGGHSLPVPRQRYRRMLLGLACVIGGLLWMLPLLGLWMLPVGICLLAMDLKALQPLQRWILKKTRRWRTLRFEYDRMHPPPDR